MSFCPESLFGYDVDYLFAYPTTKFVRIQDARLGLFKYVCTFGIISYVGIYQLWYEGAYMEQSSVTGAVRFTLQQPTQNSCDPTVRGCKNQFTPVNELDYCLSSGLPYPNGNQYPCQFYENIGSQQIMDKSILVSTRITSYEEELVCNITDSQDCPFIYNISSETTNYVVDAEQFTVLIDHSVVAASSTVSLSSPSSEIKGRLFVEKNKQLCKEFKHRASSDARGQSSWSPSDGSCYIAPNETSRNLDYFSLDVLMRAANSDLDNINYNQETFRETGATMLLSITYDNFKEWRGKQSIFYYYSPSIVKQSSYKFYDTVYSSYRERRTLINKHGIFIEAVQGGVLREFSFNTLLIQLTTSLTLLAAATVITDFVALYLLPDSEAYENYKYELTEDFSDRRAAQAAAGGGDISLPTSTHAKVNQEDEEDEESQNAKNVTSSLGDTLKSPLIDDSMEDDEGGEAYDV